MLDGRIDLRSDTVTRPTDAMLEAMRTAPLGDDVLGDDPTVKRLEETACALLGKEAAVFLPSGTMANLVAVLSHAQPGEAVILEARSHIYLAELGGAAVVGGVVYHPIPGRRGAIDLDRLAAAVSPHGRFGPRPAVICLENTHNLAGGTVLPLEYLWAVRELAERHGVPIHIDGARLFNAATALGRSPRELAEPGDSVMFSLSKGLSAPVGSVLTGLRSFVETARKWRKRLGGGMRQAGVLAAAGLVALETMVERLREDHETAARLARGLAELPGIWVDLDDVETNIVVADVAGTGLTAAEFTQALAKEGCDALPFTERTVRFVTHRHITPGDVDLALAAIRRVLETRKEAG